MIEKTIQIFTEKEEELVNLLVRIGTRRTVAKTLVYLSKTKKATTRNIELGADLRQPEVSMAMKYLAGRGWGRSQEIRSEGMGRPTKVWTLALPVPKILDIIGNEKREELKSRVEMLRRVRGFA